MLLNAFTPQWSSHLIFFFTKCVITVMISGASSTGSAFVGRVLLGYEAQVT